MDLESLRNDVEKDPRTQKQIGELIGRDQSSISKYLSDERNINIKVFENICEILGVPPYKYFISNNLKQKLITAFPIIKDFLESL